MRVRIELQIFFREKRKKNRNRKVYVRKQTETWILNVELVETSNIFVLFCVWIYIYNDKEDSVTTNHNIVSLLS